MKIISVKLNFTETNYPILGKVLDGEDEWINGFLLRQRSVPKSKNPLSVEDYYTVWEVVGGDRSRFFPTRIQA